MSKSGNINHSESDSMIETQAEHLKTILLKSISQYYEAYLSRGEGDINQNPYISLINKIDANTSFRNILDELVKTELSKGPKEYIAIETPFIVYVLLTAKENDALHLFNELLPKDPNKSEELVLALNEYVLEALETQENNNISSTNAENDSTSNYQLNRNQNLQALFELLNLLESYAKKRSANSSFNDD